MGDRPPEVSGLYAFYPKEYPGVAFAVRVERRFGAWVRTHMDGTLCEGEGRWEFKYK